MPNLLVCCIVAPPLSDTDEGVMRMKESLDYYGYDYTILKGRPYKWRQWWQMKMEDVWNGLKEKKGYDIVLYTDIRDAVTAGPPEEAIQKFEAMNTPMVMSAEVNCHPDKYYQPFFDAMYPGKRWRYPNAGQWMAKYDVLMDYYERHQAHYNQWGGRMGREHPGWMRFGDDQLAWTAALYEKRLQFSLDVGCQLFQTMYRTEWDEYEVVGKRYGNKSLKSTPTFFHGNGTATRFCWELADRLKSLR